jgi:hypothetical protein
MLPPLSIVLVSDHSKRLDLKSDCNTPKAAFVPYDRLSTSQSRDRLILSTPSITVPQCPNQPKVGTRAVPPPLTIGMWRA